MAEQSQLKEMGIHIMSGASAGFVEVCCMQPLDIIKTRIQLQTHEVPKGTKDPHLYTGIIDCLQKMYKHEGILSIYKGILPPILAETPRRAVKFTSFEQYKKMFLFGEPSPTPLTFSLAGLCAGVTEGIFINPFEVVKVNLQSDKTHSAKADSTWQVTKRIIKNDGFGFEGLNKGITATICRNGTFNALYLGFYFSMKNMLPVLEDPLFEVLKKLGLGFTAGTLGALVNIPFDVVKSRIQGPQPKPGEVKYKGTLRTIRMIYREEGFVALYKGLAPKILRLGPGGAILLVVYEYALAFYTKLLS